MNLIRIAARVAKIQKVAAYGFKRLPGFGTHFRSKDIDRYESIPEDLRDKLKQALENHVNMTAWCYKHFRTPESRGDPVKGFNTLKRGAIADTRKILDEIESRYPEANLGPAYEQADALADFELTNEIWEQNQWAYDEWMYFHHDLMSHLVYVLFDEEARKGNVGVIGSILARIATRVAFKLNALPMGEPHVYEDDVDEDFAELPESLRNMAKMAIRSHDKIQDWANDQSFSIEDAGDPVKQFTSKRSGPLMDAKNLLNAVKEKYPSASADLSKAANMIDDLKAFKPKYEEEAESMVELPSSTTNNWTWYLHDVISHALRAAEKAAKSS